MAIKKSEIYSQIWAACDKLRGGVEPARYKDYILTLLFVKYVSDRFKSSDNWDIEVPEGGSFDDVIALKLSLIHISARRERRVNHGSLQGRKDQYLEGSLPLY